MSNSRKEWDHTCKNIYTPWITESVVRGSETANVSISIYECLNGSKSMILSHSAALESESLH
jgi:hypothetical protein